MARLGRRQAAEEKVLDVDAGMQGSMTFKDPVNLRINGKFEGSLSTRGKLTIGQNAQVNADIEGDDITVAGKVDGNITAKLRLKLIAPGRITGDISTPLLSVSEGAVLEGKCHMEQAATTATSGGKLTLDEVARYLEVKPSLVSEWAAQGKIPAQKEAQSWIFEKSVIDKWVSKEKVR